MIPPQVFQLIAETPRDQAYIVSPKVASAWYKGVMAPCDTKYNIVVADGYDRPHTVLTDYPDNPRPIRFEVDNTYYHGWKYTGVSGSKMLTRFYKSHCLLVDHTVTIDRKGNIIDRFDARTTIYHSIIKLNPVLAALRLTDIVTIARHATCTGHTLCKSTYDTLCGRVNGLAIRPTIDLLEQACANASSGVLKVIQFLARLGTFDFFNYRLSPTAAMLLLNGNTSNMTHNLCCALYGSYYSNKPSFDAFLTDGQLIREVFRVFDDTQNRIPNNPQAAQAVLHLTACLERAGLSVKASCQQLAHKYVANGIIKTYADATSIIECGRGSIPT